MKSKTNFRVSKPARLHRGDPVALIRPGGYLDEKAFSQTLQWVEEFGFEVFQYKPRMKQDFYFAGTDRERAREWSWAFSNPEIKAVLACRGGYGTMRTLGQLMPAKSKIFKSKILTGFSDLTFAHQWIYNQFRHLSFHSALVGQLPKPDLYYFLNQLLDLPEQRSDWSLLDLEVLQKGSARGVLMGGNLSLFQTAGPASFPKRPMILAIEEINEDFYRIDRSIWSLIHAGYSPWVRGILLGKWTDCGRDQDRFSFGHLLGSLKKLCSGPIWRTSSFGHSLKRQQILPIGMPVHLTDKKMIWSEGCVE